MNRNVLIRFFSLLLLVLAAAKPVEALQDPAAVTVRVAPAVVRFAPGQVAEFAVEVVDVQGLYGIDLSLAFDPEMIEVVDANPLSDVVEVAQGAFLDSGFVVRNQADNDAGTIWFAMTQLNPSVPKDGTGNLIVVTLRARNSGRTGPLSLARVQLARNDGSPIPAQAVSGEVLVDAMLGAVATNTPIPTQAPGTPLPTAIPPEPTRPAALTPTSAAGTSATQTASPLSVSTETIPEQTETATVAPVPTGTPMPTVQPPTATVAVVLPSNPVQPDTQSDGLVKPVPNRDGGSVSPAPEVPQEIVTSAVAVTESRSSPLAASVNMDEQTGMGAVLAPGVSADPSKPVATPPADDTTSRVLLVVGVSALVAALFIGLVIIMVLRRQHAAR